MIAKFQSIINSSRPVVVDFYAGWCVPCRQMPPILKEVKDELKEQVRIIKVDVDKNPAIATRYQIRSIPTIIVFKEGQNIWTMHGVPQASEIKSVLRRHISDQQS